MDKAITSQKRGKILNGDWEAQLTDLIKQFRSGKLLSKIEMRLPIGYSLEKREFGKLDDYQMGNVRRKRGKIRFMNLFVKKTRFDSINVGLEMSFKMPIVESYKMLKNDFHYKWDYRSDNVTITRFIGSTDIEVLEENINMLLRECMLFKNLYEDKEEAEKYNKNNNILPF